jgi:hypothetical protein
MYRRANREAAVIVIVLLTAAGALRAGCAASSTKARPLAGAVSSETSVGATLAMESAAKETQVETHSLTPGASIPAPLSRPHGPRALTSEELSRYPGPSSNLPGGRGSRGTGPMPPELAQLLRLPRMGPDVVNDEDAGRGSVGSATLEQ